MTAQLTNDQKMEAFRILVESQDGGAKVSDSRQRVADQFSLDVQEVIAIERFGITNNWPPLDG